MNSDFDLSARLKNPLLVDQTSSESLQENDTEKGKEHNSVQLTKR